MTRQLPNVRELTAMLRAAAGDDGETGGPVGTESDLDSGPGSITDLRSHRWQRKLSDAVTTSFLPARSRLPFSVDRSEESTVAFVEAPTEVAAIDSEPPPLEALKYALRMAIHLEFATVPPYLCALWSIIDQAHPVARVLRAVAHEEMLHVALLCNLLSALGERPVLTGDVVPRYPSRLPGEVHPELELRLLGYGAEALDIFMEIERPETPLIIEGEPIEVFPPEDNTIGEFYSAILDVYEKILPALDPSHQIAGPFVWFVMTKPDDVRQAINLIMAQGEGARGQPFSRDPRYLAHYYRFKSLSMSVELAWDKESKMLKKGKPIEQPSVFTLAPASSRSYGLAVPKALRDANDRFEASYSQMLRLLEETWKDGGHKSFMLALEHMFELTQLAQTMMRIGTSDGRGYCPAFLYRP